MYLYIQSKGVVGPIDAPFLFRNTADVTRSSAKTIFIEVGVANAPPSATR